MKKRLFFITITLICVLGAFGCREEGGVKTPVSIGLPSQGNVDANEPSAISPIPEGKDQTMVATVNGTIITQSEIDSEIQNLIREFGGGMPADQMDKVKSMLQKQAMDNLINQTLLQQKADKDGVEPEKKAIDEKMAEIAGRFSSPEQFQEQLAAAGLTEGALRQEIQQSLKIESLMAEPMASIKEANDKEVEDFYRNNPKEFQKQEQVRASHILIAVEADESDDARAQKRLKLAGLKGEIANGADFSTLAGQHSDCPTKSKGGDLGFFEKGEMVPAFEEVAFTLKPGEVSDIVETQFGYHLIKVTDRKPAHAVPLEQVKDKVADYLNNQKRREAARDYIQGLRDSARIEYSAADKPSSAGKPSSTTQAE
ncbi:MAG: peptidylprolyl isomerase [bacterium]